MALLNCHFKSQCVGKWVQVNVILPQENFKKNSGRNFPYRDAPKRYPVLYLFHGHSDDATGWLRRTSIERYADKYNLAVVMPDAETSWYANTVDCCDFFTYVSEELPCWMNNAFPIGDKREETFVAGLSMGGYGALKLGLTFPERFAGIGALSAVADMKLRWETSTAERILEYQRCFGGKEFLAERGNDVLVLAEQAVEKGVVLPKILSFCGDNDSLLENNRGFEKHLTVIGYPEHHLYVRPGRHNWDFWDCYIQDILRYFFEGVLPEEN